MLLTFSTPISPRISRSASVSIQTTTWTLTNQRQRHTKGPTHLFSVLKEVKEKLFSFCDSASLKNLRLVCRMTIKFVTKVGLTLIVDDTNQTSMRFASTMHFNALIMKRLKLPDQLKPSWVGNLKNFATVRRIELVGLIHPKWLRVSLPRFSNLVLVRVTENALSKQLFPGNDAQSHLVLKRLERLEINCEMNQELIAQSRTGFFDYSIETVHRNIFYLLYLVSSPRLKTLTISYDEELTSHCRSDPSWNWKGEAVHKFLKEHSQSLRVLNFNDVDLNRNISHYPSSSRALRSFLPPCEINSLPRKLEFLALTLTADNFSLDFSRTSYGRKTNTNFNYNANSPKDLINQNLFLFPKKSTSKRRSKDEDQDEEKEKEKEKEKDEEHQEDDDESPQRKLNSPEKNAIGDNENERRNDPDSGRRSRVEKELEVMGSQSEDDNGMKALDQNQNGMSTLSPLGESVNSVDNLVFWCHLLEELTDLQEFHGRFWFPQSWQLIYRVIQNNSESLQTLSVGFNWPDPKIKLDLNLFFGRLSQLKVFCLCLPEPGRACESISIKNLIKASKLDLLVHRQQHFLTKLMITDALCFTKELESIRCLEGLRYLSLEFVGREGKYGVNFEILLSLLELRSLDHLVIIDFNFKLDFKELDRYRLMSLVLNSKLADSHLNSSRFFETHPVKYICIVET